MSPRESSDTASAQGSDPSHFVPPLNRMVLAILALVGFLISLYMLGYALGLVGQLICGIGNCEAVQNSPYSRVGPLPVATFGVAGYLALMAVSLWGLQPRSSGSRTVPLALLAGGALGVLFTGYLTYLEAYVIHAWCQWCVGSAVIMALAFLAILPEVKRIGETR